MRPIEWLRRNALSVTLALLAVSVAACVLMVVNEIDSQHSQTINQTKNVRTWCAAIRALDTALVLYVGRFKDAPPLQLPVINCDAIATATARSTK